MPGAPGLVAGRLERRGTETLARGVYPVPPDWARRQPATPRRQWAGPRRDRAGDGDCRGRWGPFAGLLRPASWLVLVMTMVMAMVPDSYQVDGRNEVLSAVCDAAWESSTTAGPAWRS